MDITGLARTYLAKMHRLPSHSKAHSRITRANWPADTGRNDRVSGVRSKSRAWGSGGPRVLRARDTHDEVTDSEPEKEDAGDLCRRRIRTQSPRRGHDWHPNTAASPCPFSWLAGNGIGIKSWQPRHAQWWHYCDCQRCVAKEGGSLSPESVCINWILLLKVFLIYLGLAESHWAQVIMRCLPLTWDVCWSLPLVIIVFIPRPKWVYVFWLITPNFLFFCAWFDDLTTKRYNLKAWNLKDERGVQILSKLVLEDLEGSLRSVRLTIKNFTDTEYVYFLIHLISNHLISLYDMIYMVWCKM